MGGLAVGTYVEAGRVGAPRLPVSLPPRPPLLVGREDLLAEMDQQLADGRAPRLMVLCGLGGVGKTSLAVEYAHRHLAEVGLAWQIPSEDAAVLAAGLAELAAQAGDRRLADPRDPVASAHAVLAAFPADWLLVFDNAPGEEALRRFVPPAGRGRVLVTSQSQHWPGALVIDVPVLGTDVAAGFLMSRTGDADRQAAAGLARDLGGLPLGLAQAAAYVQATGITLAGYLSLFRQRRAELLARGEASGHPVGVAATIGLALSRLAADAPPAAGLLRLLACLAPEPVPLALLLTGLPLAGLDADVSAAVGPLLGDPLATADAVAALRRYSLISPTAGGMVLVHRLVQAVTLDQLPVRQAAAWRQAASALTDAAVPADATSPAAWQDCAALLPHARAVLDLTSAGMSRIAGYLGHSGSYPAARDLFRQIVSGYEHAGAYGPEHRDTLTARHQLASYTGQAGDAAGARDQLATLLPVMERILGPEDHQTLTTRASLARWTGDADDHDEARRLYAALLPEVERVLGPHHTDALATASGLAESTGLSGDPAAARDLIAALLPDLERILGPRHPATLDARQRLALWTGMAGDPAAARDLTAALLPIRNQILGPDHPDTLHTRGNLASWTGEAGAPAIARDMYIALLPDYERVLGPYHPAALFARGAAADWTGVAGDPVAASRMYTELMPHLDRVLGPDHRDAIVHRESLIYWQARAEEPANPSPVLRDEQERNAAGSESY